MRILVVEDDDVLANGLKIVLVLAGATIDVVGCCADARAALATSEFDAVVLDVMLPDGSGIDVLKNIRAKGDRTPVLLLTALDEIADRIKGLDAGADDHLGKPFDLDELAARIRAIAIGAGKVIQHRVTAAIRIDLEQGAGVGFASRRCGSIERAITRQHQAAIGIRAVGRVAEGMQQGKAAAVGAHFEDGATTIRAAANGCPVERAVAALNQCGFGTEAAVVAGEIVYHRVTGAIGVDCEYGE